MVVRPLSPTGAAVPPAGGRRGSAPPASPPSSPAAAPVLNFVDTVTQSYWNGQTAADGQITLAKLKLVADAVYARCDAKDGLKDGLIDDPRRCDFDPSRDMAQCAGGQDGETCLTP